MYQDPRAYKRGPGSLSSGQSLRLVHSENSSRNEAGMKTHSLQSLGVWGAGKMRVGGEDMSRSQPRFRLEVLDSSHGHVEKRLSINARVATLGAYRCQLLLADTKPTQNLPILGSHVHICFLIERLCNTRHLRILKFTRKEMH